MSRKSLLRSTAAFTSMTLLSRIAGFVRDVLQAWLFGAGAGTDAFTVAYRVPNYLRRIFAEGSFSMAFVPVLSDLQTRGDRAELRRFIDHVAGGLFAAVFVVTGIGMLLAPWLPAIIAPGALDDPAKFRLTGEMLRIVFPYLLFISMTAFAGGILNSLQRFALPAFTPVLHNLAMITAMLALSSRFEVPEKALAWGVLFAGVAQFLLLWPSLARHGLLPRLRFDFRDEGVRRVAKLMLPTLFSSSVAQINLIVGTMFASLLVTGSQTWLYYSDRLTEFPLGLFGVAIGTVILPHLSRRHADTDPAGFSAGIDWGLRMVLLLGVPAGLGLGLLAEPLVTTVYGRGQFAADPANRQMTALALTAMSIGIPAFMLTKVLAPAFYARQDTRTPMRAAIRTVAVNVALTVAFVTPMRWWQVPGAHAGIALATALAGIVNAFLLWRALVGQGLFQPRPGWSRFLVQLGAASLALTVVVLLLRHAVGDFAALHEWRKWLTTLGVVAAGGGAYAAMLLATGIRPRHLRGG